MESRFFPKIKLGNKGDSGYWAKILGIFVTIMALVLITTTLFPLLAHMSCLRQMKNKLYVLENAAYESRTGKTTLKLPSCVKSIYEEDRDNKNKGNICIEMNDGDVDCSHNPGEDGFAGHIKINYIGFDRYPRIVSRLIKSEYSILIMPQTIQVSEEEFDIVLTDNFYNLLKCLGMQCLKGCEKEGKVPLCKDYGIEGCRDCRQSELFTFPYNFQFDLTNADIPGALDGKIVNDCENPGPLTPSHRIIISKNVFKESILECVSDADPNWQLTIDESFEEKLAKGEIKHFEGRTVDFSEVKCTFKSGKTVSIWAEGGNTEKPPFYVDHIYICEIKDEH